MLVRWSGCSQLLANRFSGDCMTLKLLISKDWRTFSKGQSYDVPKPLADILIRRGFAVVKRSPNRRRRKKADDASNETT